MIAAIPSRPRLGRFFGDAFVQNPSKPWSGELKFPLFERPPKIDLRASSTIHPFATTMTTTPLQSPLALPRSPLQSESPSSAASANAANKAPSIASTAVSERRAVTVEELIQQVARDFRVLKTAQTDMSLHAQRQSADLDDCIKASQKCLGMFQGWQAGDAEVHHEGAAFVTNHAGGLAATALGEKEQPQVGEMDLFRLSFRIGLLSEAVIKAKSASDAVSARTTAVSKEVQNLNELGASDAAMVEHCAPL